MWTWTSVRGAKDERPAVTFHMKVYQVVEVGLLGWRFDVSRLQVRFNKVLGLGGDGRFHIIWNLCLGGLK